MQKLNADQFFKLTKSSFVIDTRPSEDFMKGFIPGSVSVPNSEILLTFEKQLSGFDSILLLKGKRIDSLSFPIDGVLNEDFNHWLSKGLPWDMIIDIDAYEFSLDVKHDPGIVLIDVRSNPEFIKSHLDDSINLTLDRVFTEVPKFDPKDTIYIYGEDLERVITAASVFKYFRSDMIKIVNQPFSDFKSTDFKIIKPGNKVKK